MTRRIEFATFDSSDIRSRIPRFAPEARKANQVFIDLLAKIGEQKGATPAQIALAWLLAQKPWIVPIPGSRKIERLDENIGAVAVELTSDDPARAGGASVTFEPGARTAWHAHPLGQTLIVTAGCGWVQHGMKTMDQVSNAKTSDSDWRRLYRVGGVAALVAGILFRRNLAAEIGLFSPHKSPVTVSDWFALLQSNRLLGLAYLNIFDLVNYALVALMFLALYAALRRASKSYMAIATALGFLGIAVYFASNTALSMLSLSDQYAVATTEAQRTTYLGAGEAMLAINRFSSAGSHPGSGGYLSLLLIAVAGMIISIVMLRSDLFNRATAYVGILASALDLVYCLVFAFVPTVDSELLALLFIPAAGLLLMIWHIMVGWRLYRLGKETPPIPAQS
jgi:quercetin dioxygenase-like cupin family protein